jgi:hypothetical protein
MLPLVLVTGCSRLFNLDPVEVAPDAVPDGPPDASPDAPTVLTCTTSPIVLLPVDDFQPVWSEQFPATGTHADKVRDVAPDDDATYIASQTDGQFDLYTHLPLDSNVTIDSVTFWVRARLDAPVMGRHVGTAWRVSNETGWDDVTVSATWADYTNAVYTTNPQTFGPWTVADVNEMMIGVRKSYNDYRVLVTRVWATVQCH